MKVEIWYCLKCKRALVIRPALIAKSCKCKTPRIPKRSTTVHMPDSDFPEHVS